MKLPPLLLMHGSIVNGIWPRSLDKVDPGNVFPGPLIRAKFEDISGAVVNSLAEPQC